MKALLLALCCLFACGRDSKVLVRPVAKTLEIGESAHFILDRSQSSRIIQDGYFDISISDKNQEVTTVKLSAKLLTAFGPQSIDMSQLIENDILTPEFMSVLRDLKTHRAKEFSVAHNGINPIGCDKITVKDIKGQDGTVIEALVCLASSTLPEIKVDYDGIKAAFLQEN